MTEKQKRDKMDYVIKVINEGQKNVLVAEEQVNSYNTQMTLEEILVKPPEQWTDEDYKTISKAQRDKGHGFVKGLRDRLNKPVEQFPEEQVVS